MKRASLKTAKVPIVAFANHDVTDRLLKTDGDLASRTPKSSDTPKRRARSASSSPTAHDSRPTSPSLVASRHASRDHLTTGQPDPLALALAQTHAALSALNAARVAAPARYDLAVRYRLDALAHHLEQVTQFIAGRLA